MRRKGCRVQWRREVRCIRLCGVCCGISRQLSGAAGAVANGSPVPLSNGSACMLHPYPNWSKKRELSADIRFYIASDLMPLLSLDCAQCSEDELDGGLVEHLLSGILAMLSSWLIGDSVRLDCRKLVRNSTQGHRLIVKAAVDFARYHASLVKPSLKKVEKSDNALSFRFNNMLPLKKYPSISPPTGDFWIGVPPHPFTDAKVVPSCIFTRTV
jgi:hypothetical protein